jgi:hypothetical protein
VGQKQVELEELGSAVVRFRACTAILSSGRGIAEDELVECQNKYAQQEGDGHRRDEGDVEIKLPRKGTFVRAQVAQKAHQKNQDFHGDDEPEVVDEKTFQLHPVKQGGQSAMFFFFFGAHLNSLNDLGGDLILNASPFSTVNTGKLHGPWHEKALLRASNL